MHININVPDPKPDPLLKQLLRQFEGIQRHLLALKSAQSKDSGSTSMDGLVRAMERLLTQMKQATPSHGTNGLGKKLDRLTETMSQMGTKTRNRTFGSNY